MSLIIIILSYLLDFVDDSIIMNLLLATTISSATTINPSTASNIM